MYWKFNSSSLYTIKLFQMKILRCSYRTKKQLVYYNVLVVAKRQTMSRRRDNLWIIIWLPHNGYCCSSYKLILNIWNVHRCWRWVSYRAIRKFLGLGIRLKDVTASSKSFCIIITYILVRNGVITTREIWISPSVIFILFYKIKK